VRTQSKDEAPLTGKVVLDAMGSDHAPHAEIDGALAAARDLGVKVILVGQPEKLEPELKVHEQMEEAALYGPVASEVGFRDATLREWQELHHDEVTEAEELIQEISGIDSSTDEWMEKVEDLQETLEQHIQEEEGDTVLTGNRLPISPDYIINANSRAH